LGDAGSRSTITATKGDVMREGMSRQRQLMDRTGLGLLPGLGLAFAICMIAIAAVQFEEWWVIAAVLAFLFAVTGAVVWVVVQVLGDESGSDRD
jgi:hypothetical protein